MGDDSDLLPAPGQLIRVSCAMRFHYSNLAEAQLPRGSAKGSAEPRASAKHQGKSGGGSFRRDPLQSGQAMGLSGAVAGASARGGSGSSTGGAWCLLSRGKSSPVAQRETSPGWEPSAVNRLFPRMQRAPGIAGNEAQGRHREAEGTSAFALPHPSPSSLHSPHARVLRGEDALPPPVAQDSPRSAAPETSLLPGERGRGACA